MNNPSDLIAGLPTEVPKENVLHALSFYSPIIVTISILVFSLFSGIITKGLLYIFWIIIITGLRTGVLWIVPNNDPSPKYPNEICAKGNFLPYDNVTYSTYVLCFTLAYFAVPMFMAKHINYAMILFLLIYLCFDIFLKFGMKCVLSPAVMIGDIFGGLGLGAGVSAILQSTPMKKYLFTSDGTKSSASGETCSMPSKQQFKCSVYKNGELVSSTIS